MPLEESLLQEIRQSFQMANRIMVASHIRPDGDAVGSLLGLGLALEAEGKEVHMVLVDGAPRNFKHLDGIEKLRAQPQGVYDLVCLVDCSDLERAGSILANEAIPDINIDHHKTNSGYARINLVDLESVATAEIIADLLVYLEIPLTPQVGAALLTGLITDTIGFRTSNMTPKALRLAADLMDTGVDISDLYNLALVNRSYDAIRLWGVGLSKLERNGHMLWTDLTLADRVEIGYPGRDDADLINVLGAVDNADIVVIFLEQPNERVKVSWRARPGFDVSKIAGHFGGGGHPAAAGADIEGSLHDVKDEVLTITNTLLK